MPEPVKIIVNAETEQAAAAMKNFTTTANAGFQQLAIGARQAGERVAGMSYYFRSGIDSIRFALAGGGARAGFYAIDEAVRGLISSGKVAHGVLADIALELAEITPLFATAALGASAFSSFLARPLPLQEYLVKQNDELKKQAALLDTLNKLKSAGVITPEQFAKYSSQPAAISMREMMGKGLVVPSKEGGELSEPTQALLEIKKIYDELNQSTLTGSDKKVDELTERFLKLKDAAMAAGLVLVDAGRMSKAEFDALIKTVDDAGQAATDKLVAGLNAENVQRNQKQAHAASLALQRMFNEQFAAENKQLDSDLELSAAKQGQAREGIWKEEYAKRTALATDFFINGLIDEDAYTNAMQEATTKRLVGANKEGATIQAIRDRLAEAGKSDLERQLVEINLRYDTEVKSVEKLNLSLERQRELINEINAARSKDLSKAKQDAQMDAELNAQKFQSITKAFENMMGIRQNLSQRESQIEDRIDAEREQGVYQMFGNMAAAAKVYGQTGMEVYKAFAIAQATIDTAKSAIAAYSAVAGIPYVGPILAPIAAAAAVAAGAAQIANIESAGAREHGGPIVAGRPYLVGEAGPELVVPSEDADVLNAHDTRRVVGIARNSSRGFSSSDSGSAPKIAINFFSDPNEITKHIRNTPDVHHVIVDVARRNARQILPSSS